MSYIQNLHLFIFFTQLIIIIIFNFINTIIILSHLFIIIDFYNYQDN